MLFLHWLLPFLYPILEQHNTEHPFADPNHPLDYRDGKLIYARDAADVIIPPRTEPNPPRRLKPTGIVAWNNVQWEHPAYREAGQTEKKLLAYDASLARLHQAGYERHPRSAETMQFLAAGLEGKLTGQHKAIFDDMLTSYGEWMDIAFLVEKKKTGGVLGIGAKTSQVLTVYIHPEGLVWDGSKYVQQNFKYAEKKEFDITGKPLNAFVELNAVDTALVQDFYGCSYAQLPQQMREGDKRGGFWFPSADQIWPVGRGNFSNDGFVILRGISRASRGVRAVAPKSPQKV